MMRMVPNSTVTYFPNNLHYTQDNLSAFGIFMFVIAVALLMFGVYLLFKQMHLRCQNCCHDKKDKMYHRLMAENYELRKEYKRDLADLRELIAELKQDTEEDTEDNGD